MVEAFSPSTSSTVYFYNKGFEQLKKANYNNLIVDLAGNSTSVALLKKYKSSKLLPRVFYIVDGVIAVGGVINLYNGTKKDANPKFTDKQIRKAETVMGIGVGTIMIGTIISFNRRAIAQWV